MNEHVGYPVLMATAPTGAHDSIKTIASARWLVALLPRAGVRDGLVHRVAVDAARAEAPLLILDGTGVHAAMLAGREPGRITRWLDADDRHHLTPTGPWTELHGDVASAFTRQLVGWLRPAGTAVVPAAVDAAMLDLARLTVRLPGMGLYGWVRWLEDPAWRKRTRRTARRHHVSTAALDRIHPRTPEGRLLKTRIHRVLRHDDALDRAFCLAQPTAETRWLMPNAITIVTLRSDRAGLTDHLLWLQTLVALSSCKGPKPPHICLIHPPSAVLPLLAAMDTVRRDATIRLIFTRKPDLRVPDLSSRASPISVLGHVKSPLEDIEWLSGCEPRQLKQRFSRGGTRDVYYLHRHGSPDRRAVMLPIPDAPPTRAGYAIAAANRGRALQRPRHDVHRQRLALQRNWQSKRQRHATRDLLAIAMEPDRLMAAWRRVARNRGAAGTDGVTVEDFARSWHASLMKLRKQVLDGTWNPKDYRRLYQMKANGGQRPMSIPTVADRVLQTAVAEALSETLDPGFSDASFGYRPARGAQRAVLRLCAHPTVQSGTAVIADIATYFDTIDHRRMLRMLRAKVSDDRLVRLIERWLTNHIRDDGLRSRITRGVPQGSPVSPVLSNLYLTPLDHWMTEQAIHYVRYADDFIAVVESTAGAVALATRLERFLHHELGLSLKPAKTWMAQPDEGFDFLGFRITHGEPRIQPAKHAELLREIAAVSQQPELDDDSLRRFDAWVRGVRGYFDLGLDSTYQDLCELERARRDAVEQIAARLDEPADVLLGRTESFTPLDHRPPVTPGDYSNLPEPDEPSAVLPGPTSWDTRTSEATPATRTAPESGCAWSAGHLEVLHHGAWVTLQSERLVVEKKRSVLFEVPLSELRSVRMASYGLGISTRLMHALVDKNVPVFFGEPVGTPWGIVQPTEHRAASTTIRAQLSAPEQVRREIILDLIGAKIANQERLLRYHAKGRRKTDPGCAGHLTAASEAMRRIAEQLDAVPEPPEACRRAVFSIEGRAAQHYWSGIARLLGDEFPGRRTHGATDPWNQCLNYGYAMLYAEVWQALLVARLDPAIGYLHASPGQRAALVFDMIEPYRAPVVDRAVLGLAGRGWAPRRNKSDTLTTATRRELSERISKMLLRKHPWRGRTEKLTDAIRRHASEFASQLDGGPAARAIRVRW